MTSGSSGGPLCRCSAPDCSWPSAPPGPGSTARRPWRRPGTQKIAARVHLGKDGTITVMTGKVEGGQGARAELSQAAAEELRVPVSRIQLVMADTSLVPDDGTTAGSRSTPRTVPAVRRGAAAARELLIDFAARRWGVDRKSDPGPATARPLRPPSNRHLSYADLAAERGCRQGLRPSHSLRCHPHPGQEWKVLGTPLPGPTPATSSPGLTSIPRTSPARACSTAKSCGRLPTAPKLTSIDPRRPRKP